MELDKCKEGPMAGESEEESGREDSGDARERGICVGGLLVWVCDGFVEVHTALALRSSCVLLLGHSLYPQQQCDKCCLSHVTCSPSVLPAGMDCVGHVRVELCAYNVYLYNPLCLELCKFLKELWFGSASRRFVSL